MFTSIYSEYSLHTVCVAIMHLHPGPCKLLRFFGPTQLLRGNLAPLRPASKTCGQHRVKFGQCPIELGRHRQTLANIRRELAKSRPKTQTLDESGRYSAELEPISAEFGRNKTLVGRIRPNWLTLRQHWANFGLSSAEFASMLRNRAKLAEIGQSRSTSEHIGQFRAQIWSKSGQIWFKSPELGQLLANVSPSSFKTAQNWSVWAEKWPKSGKTRPPSSRRVRPRYRRKT